MQEQETHTPSSLYKENESLREEFEKTFDEQYPSVRSYTAGHLQKMVSDWWLSKFHLHTQNIIQNEISRLEGEKKPEIEKPEITNWQDNVVYSMVGEHVKAYNDAIQDSIDFWSRELEKIKEMK